MPYYDVNAFRAGYGSDTYTLADGTVKTVKEGVPVTRDGADIRLRKKNKNRVLPKVARQLGDDFAKLPKKCTSSINLCCIYLDGSLENMDMLEHLKVVT